MGTRLRAPRPRRRRLPRQSDDPQILLESPAKRRGTKSRAAFVWCAESMIDSEEVQVLFTADAYKPGRRDRVARRCVHGKMIEIPPCFSEPDLFLTILNPISSKEQMMENAGVKFSSQAQTPLEREKEWTSERWAIRI